MVRTVGGTLGSPADGPPRHVRSNMPSATDGYWLNCMQKDRRIRSRSGAVNSRGGGRLWSTWREANTGPVVLGATLRAAFREISDERPDATCAGSESFKGTRT